MESLKSLKLNFIQHVADESEGLNAKIARNALAKNEIDEAFEIFNEQHLANPEMFKKMMGDDVYSIYLEVVKPF